MNGKSYFLARFCGVCLCCVILCMVVASAPAFCSELESESALSTSESTEAPPTEPHIISEEVVRSVSPVTPADSSGFKAVVLGLFGNYDTVVTEHRYTSSSGYTSVSVSTEPDYAWMISAAIFTVVLYCLFRMIGGVLCGRK